MILSEESLCCNFEVTPQCNSLPIGYPLHRYFCAAVITLQTKQIITIKKIVVNRPDRRSFKVALLNSSTVK